MNGLGWFIVGALTPTLGLVLLAIVGEEIAARRGWGPE